MKNIFIAICFVLCTIFYINETRAQAYDPYAVEVINTLINVNGLMGAYPDDPASWYWFTTWSTETPKQLIELRDLDWRGLKGNAYFANLTRLAYLNCHLNRLTGLSVNGCTNLKTLICFGNTLTQLDITGCVNLQLLECLSNKLTELDVSECANLQRLVCFDNKLTQLDVSNCINMKSLLCAYNNLTRLNVGGCSNMQVIDCSDNHLTSLDLTGLTNLDSTLTKLHNQSVSLTLHNNGSGIYTCSIALNNPSFSSPAISYFDGELQSTNNQVFKSDFEVETGLSGYNLQGTIYFTYSGEPPVITTNDLPEGAVDIKYSATLSATGDAPDWNISSGSLPSGLNLSATGVISGTPTAEGMFNFTVRAENPFGGDTMLLSIMVGQVGIGNVTQNTILRMYPNPTTGELHIETLHATSLQKIEIFDVYGRKILSPHLITSSSNHLINISHFNPGIYFVKITTEAGEMVKKVVKTVRK